MTEITIEIIMTETTIGEIC